MTNITRTTLRIPTELLKAAKIQAIKDGTSLQGFINNAIELAYQQAKRRRRDSIVANVRQYIPDAR